MPPACLKYIRNRCLGCSQSGVHYNPSSAGPKGSLDRGLCGLAGAASTPVYGVLRKMTTANIANRLNWTAYRDLGVNPFQGANGAAAPAGSKRDNVVMGSPQPTLDSFFRKKPRKQ